MKNYLLLALYIFLFTNTVLAQNTDTLFSSYNGVTVDQNPRPIILTPHTTQDVQQEVKTAAASNKKIRVAGESHSTSSLILSDSSLYLKTTALNKIGALEVQGGQAYITVESGVLLGDLADYLATKGYSLGFAFPTFRGMTIAGAIATGSSGSSRVHDAIASQRVEEVEIVLADGTIKRAHKRDTKLFKALTVNLGQAGVVTKVKVKIVRQFNIRYTSTTLDLKKNSLAGFIQSPAQEDSLQILWFPNQEKAIIESGVITRDPVDPGSENVHLGLDKGIKESNYATGDFLAKGRADVTGAIDAAIEAGRVKGLEAEPRYIIKKDGIDIPSHNVVGKSHKMLLARGKKLNWAYTLTDYSFAVPVSEIEDVLTTIKEFAKVRNYSFPIAGVYMRFAKSDGGRSSYMSHIEDGSPQRRLYALIEFLEYKPKGNAPIIVNDRDKVRDELLNLLYEKHKVRFHWGKNDDRVIRMNASHPANQLQLREFMRVIDSLDSNEVFSNKFMKDLATNAKLSCKAL